MLRRATMADIPALCEARRRQLADEGLLSEVCIDDELATYFERTIADGSLVELVIDEEGEIVATAAVAFMPFPPTYTNPIGTRGYITNMYTAPAHRGRGLATQLLHELLEEAKRSGVHKLLLCASEMGRPVYQRLGFLAKDGWMELDL